VVFAIIIYCVIGRLGNAVKGNYIVRGVLVKQVQQFLPVYMQARYRGVVIEGDFVRVAVLNRRQQALSTCHEVFLKLDVARKKWVQNNDTVCIEKSQERLFSTLS